MDRTEVREDTIAQQPSDIDFASTHPSTASRSRAPIILEPSNSWLPISIHEIWAYRELLYFLVWRDLKIRYKQTVLGVAWVVLQPLLMTLIFTVFLGMLVRVPSGSIPYPLLAYIGVVSWTFFASAVLQSGMSLVTNTNLVTKIYFPRAIIPAAAVGARLSDFLVASIILVGLLFYYGITPSWNLLMFPACVLLICLLALGCGLWFAALNVRYRDVGLILPVAFQLWMFVSPVVYPASLVPERWQWLYRLNPMAGAIEGLRSSLLNKPFDWIALGVAALIAMVILVYSMFAFRRMETYFADIV